MLDNFDKLPQFLQLCIGLGAIFGAAFAVHQAFKLRQLFHGGRDDSDDWDVYERMERFGQHIDQRYDRLEERVRKIEIRLAVLEINRPKMLK